MAEPFLIGEAIEPSQSAAAQPKPHRGGKKSHTFGQDRRDLARLGFRILKREGYDPDMISAGYHRYGTKTPGGPNGQHKNGSGTMSVERILQGKGRAVATIEATRTLKEVVQILVQRKIGALPVVAGRDLIGILSERDIIRALSVHGPAALELPVSSVMTQAVQTITRQTKVEEAMKIMTEGRFRHLPVLEEGELIGIVSIGDVVKARLDAQQMEVDELRSYVAGAA
jgi:CBS domain-containing protein